MTRAPDAVDRILWFSLWLVIGAAVAAALAGCQAAHARCVAAML